MLRRILFAVLSGISRRVHRVYVAVSGIDNSMVSVPYVVAGGEHESVTAQAAGTCSSNCKVTQATSRAAAPTAKGLESQLRGTFFMIFLFAFSEKTS